MRIFEAIACLESLSQQAACTSKLFAMAAHCTHQEGSELSRGRVQVPAQHIVWTKVRSLDHLLTNLERDLLRCSILARACTACACPHPVPPSSSLTWAKRRSSQGWRCTPHGSGPCS